MSTTSNRVFAKWDGAVRTLLTKSDETTPLKIHPKVRALLERERLVFGTAKCMERRLFSISATDFNTIVHKLHIRGGNKYRNINKLILQKLGLGTKTFSQACSHGTFYEPEALRVYEQVTGNELIKEDIGFCRGAPVGHCQEDYIMPEFVGATPDGVCKYKPILVEIKCPYWKKVIKGGVPDIYWSQIQCQMAVTGIHTVHFVRYLPQSLTMPGEIDIIEEHFDKEWWNIACKHAIQFFERLTLIREGKLPVPAQPVRRPRKKSPVEVHKPQKKRCKLILAALTSTRNQSITHTEF